MPISRDLFDEDIDDLDKEIIDFLKDSPKEAFSLAELIERVGLSVESMVEEAKLIERLRDLDYGEHIRSRNIHGVLYISAV